MKLNVAAVLFFFLLSTGPALALDGIDLGEAPVETAPGECPRLIQIKYPFLSCVDGQIGNDTWENSRRSPVGGSWTEGNGHWGPELNDPNDPDAAEE